VYTAEYKLTFGGPLAIPSGLTTFPPHFHDNGGFHQFSDSSWGRPKPLGGYCTMFNNGALNQHATSLKSEPDSTAEAETAVASRACKDARFHRLLHYDLGRKIMGPSPLLVDNKALYDLVLKPGASAKTRYFERATRFVKYACSMLFVKLWLIPTKWMVADMFTKPLDNDTFNRHRAIFLNLRNSGNRKFDAQSARLLDKLKSMILFM